MKTYHLYSKTSGLSYGLYRATDADAATRAMLRDAGVHHDDIDPTAARAEGLRVRELDGTPVRDGELSTEQGTCCSCDREGWLSDHPDGLVDVLVADPEFAGGEPLCGRCAEELRRWHVVIDDEVVAQPLGVVRPREVEGPLAVALLAAAHMAELWPDVSWAIAQSNDTGEPINVRMTHDAEDDDR